jgi:hypothetical protein
VPPLGPGFDAAVAANRRRRLQLAILSAPLLAVAMLLADGGHAQGPDTGGQVSTPPSSIERPGDAGARAHTNFQTFVPNRRAAGMAPPSAGHQASPAPVNPPPTSGGGR